MSYAKSLRNALKDKNEALFNRLQQIEDCSRRVLTYTASKFPYYTPHDFAHSLNVEEILNWLVSDKIKSEMNDHEIFFLLVAAWLHDWGMVASEGEKAEEVRHSHHIRTETNFEKLHDKIHLSLNEARIVGRICRGHREEDLLGVAYDESFFGSNILIRRRFLAALLRVADECDVTENRTPEVVYYSLKPEGASDEEFQKHLSIAGIGKLAPHKLLLSGVAKTPKGVEVIEGVRNRIQSQLNSVKAILASHDIMLDLVEAHIDTRGFINKPIAFELERKQIVDLLIGTALYSRQDVAVRELLQNAVDTCRLRKVLDDDYEPHIDIEFDAEKLSFEDNGLGMNFEDALNYFSRKGTSFYVSQDLEEILQGKQFDPISRFGIGVLSSFIIADKMIIETKKSNCAACRFTISNLGEGWTYEEGSRQAPGTRITLVLNDKGRRTDFVKSLSHYAKAVTIPISITDPTTGVKQGFSQSWTYNIPEIIEIMDKNARVEITHADPLLSLRETTADLDVTYHVFEKGAFSGKNCFILRHGVYVGNFDLFPCKSHRWIALINCTSDLFDLTASREDLVENTKFRGFLKALYSNLLNALARECDSTPFGLDRCARSSSLFRKLFMSAFGENAESPKILWHHEYNTKRVYPILLKSGLSYLTGDQVMSKGFLKIIHYFLPLAACREHLEEVSKRFQSRIDSNEAIVFDMGPMLCYIVQPRRFLCSFCEMAKSAGVGTVECSELCDLLQKSEFVKEVTPIDHLLPKGSFFTRMPEGLRSLVAQAEPFVFLPSVESVTNSRASKLILNALLAGRELSRNDPEISDLYDKLSKVYFEEEELKVSSSGCFAYDLDDPFLKHIVSRAEQIASNEHMKRLVERYLSHLASFYCLGFGPTRFMSTFSDVYSVFLLERILAEMLDHSEDHIPLTARMGSLTRVYNQSIFEV